MIAAEDLNVAVEHAVRNLRRAVRNVRKFYGKDLAKYPPILIDHPVVHLRDDLLTDAKVFASRESMLAGLPFPKGGTCCEIGTSTGVFAKRIINVLKPSLIHIVDIDFSRFDQKITENPAVRVHEGDSTKLIKSWPDKSIDFAYIDADHSYKFVKSEIAALKPKMKPGSYMMFNDYTRWSITEVLSYGVVSAVNEFMVADGARMVGIALTGTGHFDVAVQLPG